MSESVTVSSGADRRTIGAILRSHGYVTDAQLQDASDVQARTGKPLGQVLVEAGVITRLELASALAEQWSDSSDWMHAPSETDYPGSSAEASAGIGLTAQRHEPDTAVLAARLAAVENGLQEVLRSESATVPLEHAVADLARRITTLEPTLAELERRTDSAVDADALESHLAELAAAVEQASQRSDEAAREVARFAADVATLEDLHSRHEAATDPSEVAELRGQLARLAERPSRDAELAARVSGIAERLDTLATRPAADPVVTERLDRLAVDVATLGRDDRLSALQASVAEIASRPRESPELAERLDDLSRRVDALVVEAGARVGGDVPDELRQAVEELASRPPLDAALAARVDEIGRQLSVLPSVDDLARLRDTVSALSSRLDERARSFSDRMGALASTDDVAGLRQTVAEMAARAEGDESLSDRVWRLAERVDSLADATDGLAARTADDSTISGLRAAVDELASRQDDHGRLDLLQGQLDALATRSDDTARILAAQAAVPAPDEAVAALAARLDELDRRLSDLPAVAEPAGAAVPAELAARLEGAEQASQGLAAELSHTAEIWYAGRAELEARLERLEGRIAAGSVSSSAATGGDHAAPLPQVIEQEVERVLMAVERLGLHLSEHDRALKELMSRRGPSKVEELAARIDELETYGLATAGAVSSGTAGGDGSPAPVSLADTRDLRAELRSLGRQVAELEDSSKTDREKFLTQLERVASSIDWRIRRIESGETP